MLEFTAVSSIKFRVELQASLYVTIKHYLLLWYLMMSEKPLCLTLLLVTITIIIVIIILFSSFRYVSELTPVRIHTFSRTPQWSRRSN
jgi:hypothetical protein